MSAYSYNYRSLNKDPCYTKNTRRKTPLKIHMLSSVTMAWFHYKCRHSRYRISIMTIRRSWNRSIFIARIPLLVRRHTETPRCLIYSNNFCKYSCSLKPLAEIKMLLPYVQLPCRYYSMCFTRIYCYRKQRRPLKNPLSFQNQLPRPILAIYGCWHGRKWCIRLRYTQGLP